MKRPAYFLPILFITILFSSAVIAITISGICTSLYRDSAEKNINAKIAEPAKVENAAIMASMLSY